MKMSEKEQKQWYVYVPSEARKKVKGVHRNEVRTTHLEDYISQVLIPTEKVYQHQKR